MLRQRLQKEFQLLLDLLHAVGSTSLRLVNLRVRADSGVGRRKVPPVTTTPWFRV